MRRLASSLLTPDSGVFGQGVRFVLAGGFVALVYLLTTTLLALVLGAPFQLALVLGFCLGLTVHFTLQRTFVWLHHEGFALPLRRQASRYLAIALSQYGITAASTSLLPPLLGLPPEAVYLMTVPFITLVNFLLFGRRVFHAGESEAGA
jgi:putative flippase GtrA